MSLGTKIYTGYAVALLLALSLLSPAFSAAAGTAPTVAVKIGNHDTYARVVLECPKLTPYTINDIGGTLQLMLDIKASATIAPWKNNILTSVGSAPAPGGGLQINVGVPGGVKYRDYRFNNKIVIDIAAAGQVPPLPPDMAKAQKEPEKPGAKTAPKPAEKPVEKPVPKKEAAAPIKLQPAAAPSAQAKPAPTVAAAPAPAAAKTAPAQPKASPAEAPASPPHPAATAQSGPAVPAVKVPPVESGPVLADPEAIAAARLPGHAENAMPAWNLAITKPEGIVAATPPPVAATPAAAPDDQVLASITLSSLSPLKLAVFERFGALWIVTDAANGNLTPPAISGPMSTFMSAPKELRFKGGVAFRYAFPRKFYAHVTRQNLSWQIDLLAPPQPPSMTTLSAELRMQYDKETHEAMLVSYLKSGGDVLSFEDPEVGDALYVVPTSRPDQGVQEERHASDFEILPAFTGMVVRPLRDAVSIRHIVVSEAKPDEKADDTDKKNADKKEDDKKDADKKDTESKDAAAKPEKALDLALMDGANDVVVISVPGGLLATAEGGGAIRLIGDGDDAASDESGSHLFDFPNWQRGGLKKFQKSREELQEEISAADNPADRAGALMDLAKLYFANNFGQEALGLLQVVQDENPEVEKNPDFVAIRGAASAMSGHYKEALQDLSLPAIQQQPEVNLWIGYAAAASEQWHMADRSFPKSNRLLLQYPDNIAIPLTIYMAESALHLGRTDTALALLASINKNSEALGDQHKAAIDYLRGIAYAQKGEPDKAIALWQPVAAGLDRLYHTKASLSLARLLLQQKKITLKEAIDRVDSLRFAWRGNGLEVTTLHTLGALKVQDGQILSGLEDMKAAAALSDSLLDDSTEIHNDMQRVFTDLLTSDPGSKIKPLELVSVYTEFSSLVPPGPEADAAALNYADALIRMDLLDKASGVMEDRLKNGLAEDKVGPLGTKLAAVYLLNEKPDRALNALTETERPDLGDKQKEERALLKARAESQMRKTAEAIATLSTLTSKNAQKLKADVLWRAQQWTDAGTAIESLLPDPAKPLSDEEAGFVVNAAVAWKMAGNLEKLKEVKTKYDAAVAATKLAATFGVVTRDGGASSLADRESLLKIAGEVDMFKGFLEHYKAGLGNGS